MSVNCFSAYAVRALFALTFVIAALGATPSAAATDCPTTLPLMPGESWRDPGETSGSACFTVDLDSAGTLVIALVQPAAAPRAHLALNGVDAPGATVLHHSAATLVVAATPGTYPLRVAADDPGELLAPFRLQVHLLEPATKNERDSEIELEPNPFAGGGCPNKNERDSEIELEPNPLIASPPPIASDLTRIPGLEQQLDQLCQRSAREERQDDHGDTFLCATPVQLERPVAARIGNGQGDDSDVYRFDVTSVRPLELRTQLGEQTGEVAIELYDRHGQQLEATLAGEATRLVRTLVPGTYFVRLAGQDGAVGEYALSIGTPRP